MLHFTHAPRRRLGFTLIEVLVALAIMITGLLVVVAAFPNMLQAQRQAEILTIATALAQKKADETRRDNDVGNRLMLQIQSLTQPTAPLVFPEDERLTYSFSGVSLLYAQQPGDDPRGYPGVARVIIRYAPSFRSSQDVVYELRFDR